MPASSLPRQHLVVAHGLRNLNTAHRSGKQLAVCGQQHIARVARVIDMTTQVLQGGSKLDAFLANIAERMGRKQVAVGFMEGATYPDGTPVAAVAAWNEYGGPNRPPRPFFRSMISKESGGWGVKMAKLAKFTDYDGDKTLALMGEDIGGALIQSINDFTTPGLAESTKEAKGFAKPLIDTGHMVNSVTYSVDDGEKIPVPAGGAS